MSEFLRDDDESSSDSYDLGELRYEDDAAARRRRGLWGLLVLALASVTVVAVFSFVLGTSGHRPDLQAGPLPDGGPAVSVLPSSSVTAHRHEGSHDGARPSRRSRHGISATRRATPSHSATASAPLSASARPSASASSSAVEVASVPKPSAISTPRPTAQRSTGPCPSARPCGVGGMAAADSAINAYRARQGLQPAQVTTSSAATECATTDGAHGCTSPFAVVPVPTQNGAAAVREIVASGGDWLAGALPGGVAVGWAYLPGAHAYICAVVTN